MMMPHQWLGVGCLTLEVFCIVVTLDEFRSRPKWMLRPTKFDSKRSACRRCAVLTLPDQA